MIEAYRVRDGEAHTVKRPTGKAARLGGASLPPSGFETTDGSIPAAAIKEFIDMSRF